MDLHVLGVFLSVAPPLFLVSVSVMVLIITLQCVCGYFNCIMVMHLWKSTFIHHNVLCGELEHYIGVLPCHHVYTYVHTCVHVLKMRLKM